MTRVRHILLLATMLSAVSPACDQLVSDDLGNINTDDENCDCVIRYEPETYDVKLKLTINDQNSEVPVTVFYGNVERKKVAAEIKASSDEAIINLSTNEEYTYLAKYLKGSDTIYVPIKAKLSTSNYICHDDTCWSVSNNVINLKLK